MSKSQDKRIVVQMSPLKGSSSVTNSGYDKDSKTLAVTFASGQTYHYDGISPEVFKGLQEAKSFMKHLQANVVGKYPHRIV
ncbi:MAG: hypothetical protein A2143_00710 [Gallionellales bacterium RBG_16_57_15]|nr:MAG: hypothetical protein A2143_00710 [Gallionellales bacterium RBG_16_57_15]